MQSCSSRGGSGPVRESNREHQHNDDNTEYSTDTDLPTLVGRLRNDASSNDSTSKGSYDNHTDHDNSSIEGSDDERSIVPGLQQRDCVDSSSDDDSIPPLVGRQRNDASSDNSSSK